MEFIQIVNSSETKKSGCSNKALKLRQFNKWKKFGPKKKWPLEDPLKDPLGVILGEGNLKLKKIGPKIKWPLEDPLKDPLEAIWN